MYFSSAFKRMHPLSLSAIAFALAAPVTSLAQSQGYCYVGDFIGNQVLRFDAATGNLVQPTPYIKLPGADGVGGIGSTLAVSSGNEFINFYDVSQTTPTLLSTLNTKIGTTDFHPLKINFSPDSTKMYVDGWLADRTKGQVRVYDYSTLTLLNSVNVAGGCWGITVDPVTNDVFYTTGWNTKGADSVVRVGPLLQPVSTVIPRGKDGNTCLVGITFKSDGSFYVANGGNGDVNNDFVQHYRADGTLIDRITGIPGNALVSAFDMEIGPDKNLYVTSQNGACVVKINATTDTYDSIFIPPHPDGLQQAKTLHFTVNNVPGTPEPGSVALLIGATVPGVILLRRRRRQAL